MSDENDKLAFVFPGQGSQALGMLSGLAREHGLVWETFGEASEVLGLDLWGLAQEGPEEDLNRTENTQPALLAAGVACWRVWRAAGGVMPDMMAGHSLGEYTALVAAGSLSFDDGIRLVAERGRQMQRAVPEGEGAMAAIIGLEDSQVEEACERAADGEVVAPANYNAPGQVVIAGAANAVSRAMDACKKMGAKRALKLPVSVPSHCSLMRSAAEAMKAHLDEVSIQAPLIPVVHNVDVATHDDPGEIRRALLDQLCRPVRWTQSVRHMAGEGAQSFLECGPGKVLCGLNRRIERSLNVLPLGSPEELVVALEVTRTRQ